MSTSAPLPATATPAAAELQWRLLKLLNAFRALSVVLPLLLFLVDEPPRIFGGTAPRLFLVTAIAYLAAALVFALMLGRRRPSASRQTLLQLGVDLLALVLLLHASGGVTSGLASLLIVCVIASSLLLSDRFAFLYAALASLALLGEQTLTMFRDLEGGAGWTHVAILGAIFFATAMIGSRLARRAYESEALAFRRGVDLANLAQLNDYILQHLQTGVVVVDSDGSLSQLNTAAAAFLGVDARRSTGTAAALVPRLAALLEAWRRDPGRDPPSFPAADDGRAIVPHVLPVGVTGRRGLLVFLEDPRLQAERVQDLKLAALGRLTASIAHEIRNPLAALSHANQLLEESPQLAAFDRRFTAIIGQNVARMDAIVASVLELGRRGAERPALLDLNGFLRDAVAEYDRSHVRPGSLAFESGAAEVPARVDPTHLHQVLANLLDNAFKHGVGSADAGRVIVRCMLPASGEPIVEVEDSGAGVPADLVSHIFEPFYSGSARGTGLGLFIARELLAANRAVLAYATAPRGGACFRITFPNPARWVS